MNAVSLHFKYLEANRELEARLIWEEWRFRVSRGEVSLLDDLIACHPEYGRELERLRSTEASDWHVDFPRVGEEISGYQLVAQLGRGNQGLVFLARQVQLAHRPVVLKFTACEGFEHLNLARLQHTYIVPLYSAEDLPERRLRMLCMPFLGAITLDELLGRLASCAAGARTGPDVAQVLQQAQEQFANDLPTADQGAEQLKEFTYTNFVCRLGLCLAEALDFAHRNSLVHLDLKPSNILIAPDGRPLLLDLYLAHTPLKGGETRVDQFGGTWQYMSPEQRAAMLAISAGTVVPRDVDHRSDIYSLGLVLHEALGGFRNEQGDPAPGPLGRSNPRVSVGLGDIVSKCLKANPKDRYVNAKSLAEDLRRHLDDRPLQGVANRSWPERWRKWRRRRPLALPLYALVLVFGAVISGVSLTVVSQIQDRRQDAERLLADGQMLLRGKRFEEAERVFRRGQHRLGEMSGHLKLEQALEDHQQLAAFSVKAEQLHTTVNDLRFQILIQPLPRRSLLVLEAATRNLWQSRGTFQNPAGLPLESSVKERIHADLWDLAQLSAEVQERLAPLEKKAQAQQAALALLDEAEASLGRHPAIALYRQRLVRQLNLPDRKEDADGGNAGKEPASSWDHTFLGRAHLRAGDWAEADRELRLALKMRPLDELPTFYLGYSGYCQGNYEEAVGAFSFCVGQEPRAAGFYFRGLCHAALGRKEAAQGDFDHAVARDTYLGPAYYQRGLLRMEQRHWQSARADFELAQTYGVDSAAIEVQRKQLNQIVP